MHWTARNLPRLILLSLALLVVCSLAASETAAEPLSPQSLAADSSPTDLHLFVLAGQSNMAGRGVVSQQDQEPHPRVLMLNQAGEWVPAVDPLHFDKPRLVGVGLGRSFAIDYANDHPAVTVGLIPCAAGGSAISTWEPGGYHDQTDSHPWDDCLQRVQQAQSAGTVKGILWHQGESDSKDAAAAVYEQKLHDLIARFRSELKAPAVPFIVGQMGQFAERPWNEARRTVDAAHRSLPDRIANTAFVSSDDLAHKGDLTHFDSPSYRELGHRYYRAWQELTRRNTVHTADYTLDRFVVRQGFDGQRCWVHARAGAIPAAAVAEAQHPRVVLTTQPLLLSGSDVFYALHSLTTDDLGSSFSPLVCQPEFARRQQGNGQDVTVCDFTPQWHAASRTLLGIGQTVWYQDNSVMHVRPRATAWSVYDPQRGFWSEWQRLELPEEPKFANAGAGSVQRFDLQNGQILLPISFKEPQQTQYSVTVCRCEFDGQKLRYLQHGSELTVDRKRGLYEPSLTRVGGRFYLTMRNDDHGYVSTSDDGLNFSPPQRWTFTDGTDLGNYNTQQHWVTHGQQLYLTYTRRGADNDHVFRHRAPLFIAEVDRESVQVRRETEQILVPEHGARLGNFGVVDVTPQETWVTVAEWMQPAGVEKYGSDNRIWVARLKWHADDSDAVK